MDAPKINPKDTLKQSYPKLNQSIDNANEALRKSGTAVNISNNAINVSNEAKGIAERTQTELSQAILEGDSSPLAGQLSVGADGTLYEDGPQQRLVAEYNGVTALLAQREEEITSILNNKYRMTFNKNQLGVNIQNLMDLSVLQSKFDLMKEIGIHSIVLCPQGNLVTYTSNEITEDTISFADIQTYTQTCKDAGFNVYYKLHIECKDGKWRGEIAPSDINLFFNNYKNFIIKYASLAEEMGIKLFCVGEEMVSISSSTYQTQWADIFNGIRAVYTGKTTYGANMLVWDDEHRRNIIFNYVDYLGIDLWAKQCDVGGDTKNNYTNLNGWVIPTFEELYNTWGKKIIFTEVGYFPTPEGATTPNDASSQTWAYLDYNLQARYYRMFFQNCIGQEWFEGIWYWAEKNTSFSNPNGGLDRYSVLHVDNIPTQNTFKNYKEI